MDTRFTSKDKLTFSSGPIHFNFETQLLLELADQEKQH